MKDVAVHFANGRDVLHAYWGFLASGGLTIAHDGESQELAEGQEITLHVNIGAHRAFDIKGKVVRSQPTRAVIAFDSGDSQNRLLTAALSEKDIDMEARLHVADPAGAAVTTARLFELSEDGCCLRLNPESDVSFAVGTEVTIEAKGFRIDGCVVSACECDRCIIFGDDRSAEAVRAYVRAQGR